MLRHRLILKIKKSWIFFVAFLLVITCVLVSCTGTRYRKVDFTYDEEVLRSELVKDGSLTVAVAEDYSPFVYLDGVELKGVDAEIAKLIAQDLGLRLNFIYMPLGSMFEALKSNDKCDCAICGISITEQRKQVVNFTQSYYTDKICIATKNNSSATQQNIESLLENSNTRVAVEAGSTNYDYLKENYPDVKIITKQYSKDVIETLFNGEADVVIANRSVISSRMLTSVTILKTFEDSTTDYGMAVCKEKKYLKELIDKDFDIRINDGTIKKIIDDNLV